MKNPRKEFNANTGDLVAFKAAGSRQVGIVLKRELLHHPEYEHSANPQPPCDCIKVMWNTPLSAGPRPRSFIMAGDIGDKHVDWYPVYSKSGMAIFTIISTMDDYRGIR